MIVEYHPAVQRELEEIRDWYNGKAPGLLLSILSLCATMVAYD